MGNFYIKNIRILNFRGYNGEIEYKFIDEKGNPYSVILLSGPNGYGKTTLLDSIEWCLTGNIKRVMDDYNNRCSIQSEKTIGSTKGLIRNSNASTKEVLVQIEMLYKNEEVKIIRNFNGDNELEAFNLGLKGLIIECSNNIKYEVSEIIKNVQKSFNFNNICSYDKNIDLYKKGRADIYDIFESCYSEFYEAKKVVDNLGKFKEKLLEEKKVKENKFKEVEEKINSKQELLKTINGIDSIKIRKYPETKVFNSEIYLDNSVNNKTDIEKKLNNQLEILTNILNKKMYDYLRCVKEKEFFTLQLNEIDEISKIYKYKEKKLNKIRNIDFNIINLKIREVQLFKSYINKSDEEFLEYISELITNKDSKLNYVHKSKVILIDNNFELIRKNLDVISVLEKEKKKYDSNSDLVKVMRHLIDNEEVYKLYGKENDKCPLCGKEEFSKSEISTIAKEFLGERDKERQNLIKSIKIYNDEVIIYVNKIKEILKDSLDQKEKAFIGLIECKESLEDLYKFAKQYKININELDLERINDKKVEIQKKKSILKISKLSECYILDILKNSTMPYLIKYSKEIDEYKDYDSNTKIKLINNILFQLDRNTSDINNELIYDKYNETKLETIKDKLDITKDVISYNKSNNINNEINKLNIEIQVCANDIKSINNRLKKVTGLIRTINQEKTESEKKENERIAKPLNDIYKKITRNTNIKEINLKKGSAKNKSSLEVKDMEGNYTPFGNIMSTGQVSTLAISVYLAKAILNKTSNFKLYLMDDPIQTMDDLNILSLIDLLRFQFMESEENRFMNQLFISTCDENLENLIYHKMSSFDISIINENFINKMLG